MSTRCNVHVVGTVLLNGRVRYESLHHIVDIRLLIERNYQQYMIIFVICKLLLDSDLDTRYGVLYTCVATLCEDH